MLIGRSIHAWLLSAALVTMSAQAGAANPETAVAAAENSYAALDYATALSSAESVLAEHGLSHSVLIRATRVAALANAALSRPDQAKQLFVTLLAYDPDFKVDPKLGSRFVEPFAEARGYWHAQRKPGMQVEVLVQYGQEGQIRTSVVDPLTMVKRVIVGFRWAPARDYTTMTIDATTRTTDVPPSNESGPARLDYYVRAFDGRDDAVFEEGSPEAPRSLSLAEPPRQAAAMQEKRSIFKSPVLYAVGAGVLAAAAVGAYFAFRPTDYAAAGTARGTFAANCGGDRCN